MLIRLIQQYPNASYTKQYKTELSSDQYILSQSNETEPVSWIYILISLLVISITVNIYLWVPFKKVSSKPSIKIKDQLTNQEQNILNLILENKTNKQIADALFVSISTVKTHVNNIFKKLNVQSREAVKELFNS